MLQEMKSLHWFACSSKRQGTIKDIQLLFNIVAKVCHAYLCGVIR